MGGGKPGSGMALGFLGAALGFACYIAIVLPPILYVALLRRRLLRRPDTAAQLPKFWVKNYNRVMVGAAVLSVLVAGALGGVIAGYLLRSRG
jgi:hypothetical protein